MDEAQVQRADDAAAAAFEAAMRVLRHPDQTGEMVVEADEMITVIVALTVAANGLFNLSQTAVIGAIADFFEFEEQSAAAAKVPLRGAVS